MAKFDKLNRRHLVPGCTSVRDYSLWPHQRVSVAPQFQTVTRADWAFLHTPATQFLCRLQDLPTFTTPGKLILAKKDWLVFQKVAGSLVLREKLAEAIKELNAAARGRKLIVG